MIRLVWLYVVPAKLAIWALTRRVSPSSFRTNGKAWHAWCLDRQNVLVRLDADAEEVSMKDVQIVQYRGTEVRQVTTGRQLSGNLGIEFTDVVRLLRELNKRQMLFGSFHTRHGS